MAKDFKNVSVEPMRIIDGIEIINICDLLVALYGSDPWYKMGEEETTDDLKQWAKDHNAGYYADTKEDFSLYAASEKAKRENVKRIIVEDLS